MDSKPVKKRTQQYAEWDTRKYTSSKDGRQKRLDTMEEQRAKLQIESAKQDMLIYKQMVYELKTVLETKKDKMVRKALRMEIHANKDIIQTMIRSGVPDVPLPLDIKLQITVDKNKSGNRGSKLPKTRAQPAMESDKGSKKTGEPGRKCIANPEEELLEEEDEADTAKNRSNAVIARKGGSLKLKRRRQKVIK